MYNFGTILFGTYNFGFLIQDSMYRYGIILIRMYSSRIFRYNLKYLSAKPSVNNKKKTNKMNQSKLSFIGRRIMKEIKPVVPPNNTQASAPLQENIVEIAAVPDSY